VTDEKINSERIQGYVVFFNDIVGWGFIRGNGMKADMFVHFSQIVMPEEGTRRTLVAGQRVEFEINKREGKVQAENVVPLEGDNG
jgi:cold shock CspA family protein